MGEKVFQIVSVDDNRERDSRSFHHRPQAHGFGAKRPSLHDWLQKVGRYTGPV